MEVLLEFRDIEFGMFDNRFCLTPQDQLSKVPWMSLMQAPH